MEYKVVLLGKKGSGKTQLNYQIASQNFDFKEDSPPSIGVDFLTRTIDPDIKVRLWDICADERFKQLNQIFYKGADVGVFCIDLTEKISEKEIIESIKEFRQYAPHAPIICVGTKSDSPYADINALEKIKSKELFAGFITTSAKNRKHVEELFKLIHKHCEAKYQRSWNEVVIELEKSLMQLPDKKTILIKEELTKLSKVILAKSDDPSVNPKAKVKAIEDFAKNCETILKDEHPNILKVVLSVAAAAVVLTVTALIGFAVGVACSWWTGPGAFFGGLLGGYTAAVAVASSSTALGVVAGSITAYSLFKPSKEMKAINDFTAEVSSWEQAIIL
ncbi:Rab family GTPase [Legionella sp. WA2022007384]